MDLNRENLKKIRGLILYTILILVGIWNYEVILEYIGIIGNIIFPFVLGGAITFVLNVPLNFFERHLFGNEPEKRGKNAAKFARPVSLLLTLISVIGVIVLVMFVVVPQLGKTFISLGQQIQQFVPEFQHWATEFFKNNKEIVEWINSFELNWDKTIETAIDFLKNGAGSVIGTTYTAAKSIISGMTTFFIAFVFACYVLLQKERLSVQARKILYAYFPQKRVEKVLSICSLTYDTFSHFLTGQCTEAVILGAMFFVVMGILRLPYALLVGILIAFTALIPIFGAFIGCIVGAFLIFMVNPAQALVFVVVFFILQQIEGNFIYPHVVGNSVGLPSIWVLAAVTVGGSMMGIVGMLIFIPAGSVIYALFRENVYQRLQRKKIVKKQE